jgi:hypothetical protein
LTFSNKIDIIKNRKESKVMADVVTLVTNLGFPITICLLLMWYVREITNKHEEETKRFTEALNSNTLVLQKLCDALDVERGEE